MDGNTISTHNNIKHTERIVDEWVTQKTHKQIEQRKIFYKVYILERVCS